MNGHHAILLIVLGWMVANQIGLLRRWRLTDSSSTDRIASAIVLIIYIIIDFAFVWTLANIWSRI